MIKSRLFQYLVILVVLVIPSFSSLIRPGFFSMQDDLQAFRIYEMDKCFQDLQIPCHWVPDAGYGYGYPQFFYYSPSVYYLGEIFHLLGLQIIDSVKVLFAVGFLLAAFSMFIFLSSWLGEWPALVGALLYTYAPYKAVEVYVRGALSEFWAMIFFPLIFWSILRFIKTEKKSYLACLAIFSGLLLVTHNLMSMIFFPLALLWSILWLHLEKKWNLAAQIILGFLLGAGLSAFFILPLVFQRGDVHLESLVGGYFDYRQHFVDLRQLFISNFWGYGSSVLGPFDELSLSTGFVHTFMAILAVVLCITCFRKDKKVVFGTIFLATMELPILFLMHQKSSFIWSLLPPLVWLQFPWRFLSDSIFILSILGAVSVFLLSKIGHKRPSFYLGIVALGAIFLLHLNFFQPKDWFDLSDQQKFSSKLWEKQLTISIFDYLPKSGILPPNHKAPDLPEVLDGAVSFLSYTKGSNYQKSQVDVQKEALLRIPLFDFPGMEVRVDGHVVDHNHENCVNEPYCFGLINFKLPQGLHKFQVRLTDTLAVKAGNLLSLASILVLVGLLLKKADKRKANKDDYKFI